MGRITWTNFTGDYEGRTILPGHKLELIVWSINESYHKLPQERIELDRNELREALCDASVTLTYTDIYEEKEFKYEHGTDKFKWVYDVWCG